MKNQIKAILAALLFFGFWSCTDSNTSNRSSDGYQIAGTTQNYAAGTKVFLDEVMGNKVNVIDTAEIDTNGKFSMDGKVSQKGIGRIRVGRNSVLTVLDNVAIGIDIDQNLPNEYAVSGGYEQKEMDVLIKKIQKTKVNPEFLKAYVDTVKSPILGYLAINYLKMDKEMDTYKKFNQRLQKEMPNSFIAQEFAGRLTKQQKANAVSVGIAAPEINLASPDGGTISLSSLKGKVVLLDFWASWCKPCRRENPHVVELYEKYKNQGFEVYSVSLDKTKNRWVKAIKDDGLTWDSHVSDLAGWKSSAAGLYGVRSIPTTFLIDKDGKIIDKNLRGGQLTKRLTELFGA